MTGSLAVSPETCWTTWFPEFIETFYHFPSAEQVRRPQTDYADGQLVRPA